MSDLRERLSRRTGIGLRVWVTHTAGKGTLNSWLTVPFQAGTYCRKLWAKFSEDVEGGRSIVVFCEGRDFLQGEDNKKEGTTATHSTAGDPQSTVQSERSQE